MKKQEKKRFLFTNIIKFFFVYMDIFIQFAPKPRKTHNYCGVCLETFSDFLIHISSDSHRNNFLKHEIIQETLKIQENWLEKQKIIMPKIMIKENILNNITFNISLNLNFDQNNFQKDLVDNYDNSQIKKYLNFIKSQK